jgi:hypothetical protein
MQEIQERLCREGFHIRPEALEVLFQSDKALPTNTNNTTTSTTQYEVILQRILNV